MVAIFLLHARWQQGLCPKLSGRDQARAARRPQGRGYLCRRTGAHRTTARRWRLHRPLRLCAAVASRGAIRQVAGVRRRGHDAVLRAAATRGRHDQVEPAEDNRGRHRLALFERVEARAEGVMRKGGRISMPMQQSRRRFLTTLSIAGAAGLVRVPLAQAADSAPETTTVRIFANRPGICVAPQYIAEPLLRAEGFTDVRFVGLTAITGAPAAEAVGSGEADFTVSFAAPLVIAIDGGAAITLLSGVHVGCFELFGNEGVRSITDLKGK